MHNLMLFDVVERDQNLDSKPAHKAFRNSFKVVHLDEFIKVHRQDFERQDQMLPENETFLNPHNVFLVIWVAVTERLQDSRLNKPLLIEAFLVTKNFESGELFPLVIVALENLPERSFTDLLVDFKSISNMIVHLTNVFALVIVKTAVFGTIGRRQDLILPLHQVYEVDLIVLQNLCLFIIEQTLAQVH